MLYFAHEDICFSILLRRERSSIDIREFIHELQERRGITQTQLVELLGYKSRTTLVRFQSGEYSSRSLESFAERARNSLNLTTDEKKTLSMLMDSFNTGTLGAGKELETFLKIKPQREEKKTIDNAGVQCSLDSRLINDPPRRITLLNCCYVPLYTMLMQLAANCGTKIRHFILDSTDISGIIHYITAAISVLYNDDYSGYSLKAPAFISGILPGDVMLAEYEDGRPEELYVFDRTDRCTLIKAAQKGELLEFINISAEYAAPVKEVLPYIENEEQDYRAYSRRRLELEKDRSVFACKSDFPMNFIFPELFKAVCLRNSHNIPAEAIDEIAAIQKQRYEKLFAVKDATYYTINKKFISAFLNTGTIKEGSFLLEGFTPDERYAVVRNIAERMASYSSFNVFILSDTSMLKNTEIELYEGKGLLINNKSLKLPEKHRHTLIVQNDFLSYYKSYYLNAFINEHTYGKRESLKIIRKLLNEHKSKP